MKIQIDLKGVNRIFILEDDQMRIDWFKKVFASVPNVFITKVAKIALHELTHTRYDLIFLDHDLDCDEMYFDTLDNWDALNNNGYTVARDLRGTMNAQTPVIVHSMNPTGAAEMTKAHPFNTVAVPFHLLMQSLEVKAA